MVKTVLIKLVLVENKVINNLKVTLKYIKVLILRGNGEWTKGLHSWNISITKEARMDPEVVLDFSAECLFWGIFFCP